MVGETDNKDKGEARKIGIVLLVLLMASVVALWLLLPSVGEFAALYLEPGLGLKTAAIIAFTVSVVLMVVFAVASGDGLLGELQFMLAAFFFFFLILWLMIAWIF